MYNDSYQYLSVARNLLEGNGLSTSLLYFDEHFATGRLPAPQTVFPPGYSLLIAGLGGLGVPLEAAGYAVSIVSYLLLIPLFLGGARLLRVRGPVQAILLVLLLGNAAGWVAAFSVLSESLFTAVSLGAVVVLVKAETADDTPGSRGVPALAWGGFLAGLSCWVRYAGLFLVAAAGVYYGVRFLRRRPGRACRDLLLFAGAAAVPVVVLLGRNVLLCGSWQGGNTRPVDKPWPAVADELKDAVAGVLWGANTTADDPLLAGAFGTSAQVTAALLLLLAVYALLRWRSVAAGLRRRPACLLGTYVLVYVAALAYCGKHTAITLRDSRMVYPLLPVVLLLVGAAFPRAEAAQAPSRLRLAVIALLALVCSGYLVAQGRSALRDLPGAAEEAGTTPVEPFAAWLDQHVGRHETVLANDGQEFGYYYDRKTIGLASLTYSREPWTEERLRRVAAAYGVQFLVLFPDSGDFRVVAAESPFLRRVLDDGRRPGWIVPVASRPDCRVYRLAPARRAGRVSPGRPTAFPRAAGSGRLPGTWPPPRAGSGRRCCATT